MADQFQNELFFEPGLIKQEPTFLITDQITTASVPIPGRRIIESDLRDYSLEIENSASPLPKEEQNDLTTTTECFQILGSNQMWGTRFMNLDNDIPMDTFKMDDDDLSQIDKADLIPDPTLSELNANDDLNLDDLNFDDILLPGEGGYYMTIPQQKLLHTNNNFQPSSCPQPGFYREESAPSYSPFNPSLFSTASQHSSTSSLIQTTSPPPQVVRPTSSKPHSQLHELLMKNAKPNPGTSPGSGSSGVSSVTRSRAYTSRVLSSSAPTHLGMEQIWQRRERPHLLSTGSLAEAGSVSSLSTGGVLSPEAQDFSHDEGFDSSHDEDSDRDEDSSSDDSEDEAGNKKPSKKEKYFWQYNTQSKGPKGQRLVFKSSFEDPHVLNEVTDPVFSPNCAVRGIKHSGKARKGDGNDLTPNPRKLYSIGKELDKLSRIITDMTPVSELPFNSRPKTRKEKNKLASRACRLKKKAQHEANKLKFYGLDSEHKRLMNGIYQVKQVLKAKVMEKNGENQEDHTKQAEKLVKIATKVKIAGHSTEYVNKVLERTKAGVPGGGIDEFI